MIGEVSVVGTGSQALQDADSAATDDELEAGGSRFECNHAGPWGLRVLRCCLHFIDGSGELSGYVPRNVLAE